MVLVVVADHIILIWPIKVLPKLLEATIEFVWVGWLGWGGMQGHFCVSPS